MESGGAIAFSPPGLSCLYTTSLSLAFAFAFAFRSVSVYSVYILSSFLVLSSTLRASLST